MSHTILVASGQTNITTETAVWALHFTVFHSLLINYITVLTSTICVGDEIQTTVVLFIKISEH